jgi:hypothetical protein
MAKQANAEQVAADLRPANFRGAVQLLRTIDAKKDKISSINNSIGEVYGKIEGMKVNRKAAKIFVGLDKLEPDDRTDIIRSLNGLMDVAEWPAVEADLADQAEGNIVSMRLGQGHDPEFDEDTDAAEDDDDDEDDDGESDRPQNADGADKFLRGLPPKPGMSPADVDAPKGPRLQ